MTIVLGINAFHGDSSACLLRDGALVAAAEEERFRRIKHWAGFPSESIGYCLREAGVQISDIDHVAINQDPGAHLARKLWYAVKKRPSPRLILDRIRNKTRRLGLAEQLSGTIDGTRFRGQVHAVEHHLAHLASAFLASPFDEAAVVSVDGFGDFSSTAWGAGHGAHMDIQGRVFFPHSLGVFYQAVTQFIGFPNYGDEYKVMGLAPYGQDTYRAQMERLVRLLPGGGFELDLRYFRHHSEKVDYVWDGGSPRVSALHSRAMEELFGRPRAPEDPLEQRHIDMAHSAQALYERAFFHLLNHLHRRVGGERLAIAGGCGMNSVANGKVSLHTPFRQVYIQSAAGDAGGAIGAALVAWHRSGAAGASRRGPVHEHAYWGPSFTDDDVAQRIETRQAQIEAAGCSVEQVADEGLLCRQAAQAISEGQVVGWFQGRLEWGPRALGNRSILGDPRRADMKDILNLKIKRRESFRPFAPSVLRHSVPEWFEQDGDVPFMMQVYKIREDKRGQIPAVTHVDGTGRLQTVLEATNPRYHRLITAFAELTGVPMVLNTSFNENEPVVCQPEEALDCFLRTRMDMLVMGNWVIRR
jgi:carbamoyltransferase